MKKLREESNHSIISIRKAKINVQPSWCK